MEEINKTDLVLSLIKDNLINMKLINGLNNLGLIADDYCLGLGDTVFKLMGFEANDKNDLIFEKVFIANSEKINQIDVSHSKDEVMRLSMEIYQELLFVKSIG
jgi:hypothetical protein